MREALTGPTGNLYSSGRHLDSRAAELWFDTSDARLTVTDTNGNAAQSLVTINLNSTFDAWRAGKFTAAELGNTNISGASANPDGDAFPNLLEYAMGSRPENLRPCEHAQRKPERTPFPSRASAAR